MRLILSGAVLGAVALLVGCSGGMATGKSVYEANCVACHGISGKGDGDFASELIKMPPDLTVLARENGGEFPELRVTEVIDGHARDDNFSGAMPEFGPVLGGEETQLGPLVDYLKSLQE